MRVSLDLILDKYKFTQEELLDWCFANVMAFTWGIKSVAGITCIYFDNPIDAEHFVDKFGD